MADEMKKKCVLIQAVKKKELLKTSFFQKNNLFVVNLFY